MTAFEQDHLEDMNDPEYARQSLETTIELLRSQIRYQQAELERMQLMVNIYYSPAEQVGLVEHEWRLVGTGHAWGCDTYTDAEEYRKLAARKCPPDINPTIQHRLVTAWEDIQ